MLIVPNDPPVSTEKIPWRVSCSNLRDIEVRKKEMIQNKYVAVL